MKDVDTYIANAPKEYQPMLQELRKTILKAVPNATEKLSYQMPYYDLNGRLIYFALNKKYIGLYIPSPIIAEHKKELAGFATSNATIKIPLDQKLPKTLIIKLVKARLAKNNELKKKKA